MPTYTSRLALPTPTLAEAADGPAAIGAITTILDAAAITSSGTLAARPVSTGGTPGIVGRRYLATDQTPAPGVEYLDYGTGWVAINASDQAANVPSQRTLGTAAGQALPGNYSGLSKVIRQYHSFTMDSGTAPSGGGVLGSFFIDPSTTETVTLIEAVIRCETVGSIPSVFKVSSDHGSHGSLSDVAGLTALTPSVTTTAVTASGGPIVLSALDRVCVRTVTTGNSLGCSIQISTEHSV